MGWTGIPSDVEQSVGADVQAPIPIQPIWLPSVHPVFCVSPAWIEVATSTSIPELGADCSIWFISGMPECMPVPLCAHSESAATSIPGCRSSRMDVTTEKVRRRRIIHQVSMEIEWGFGAFPF